jgi:hypothetical protein
MRTAILRAAANRLSFLSAFLLLMSMAVSVAQARNGPSPYLKGVTTMTYNGFMKDEGRCKIDWKAWNTAIDFIANQSTKLKLMTDADYQKHFDELLDRNKEIDLLRTKTPSTWTDEEARKFSDANELIYKQSSIPSLSLSITTIELESGCAAVIGAEAKATLKPSTIISTGASVPNPDFSIWSATWTLKSPHRSFLRFAIETSERIMKEFVNDWTASQNLP